MIYKRLFKEEIKKPNAIWSGYFITTNTGEKIPTEFGCKGTCKCFYDKGKAYMLQGINQNEYKEIKLESYE